MTLADMSVITAEVKVDETDIVNVALGQSADVTVDALPGKIFKGHVTEVGDQALLRTTGVATSQSTTGTEEAKDFKVVVTLDQSPSDDLRPGLSCTAKITTAHKPDTLTIPIQALVAARPQRRRRSSSRTTAKAAAAAVAPTGKPATLVQGVYLLVTDDGRTPRPLRSRHHRHHRHHGHRSPQRPASPAMRSSPAATRFCVSSRAAPPSKSTTPSPPQPPTSSDSDS